MKHFTLIICSSVMLILAEVPFFNWEELQYKSIVKQNFDYSCGLASLATSLLTYNDTISEADLIHLFKTKFPVRFSNSLNNGLSMLELLFIANNLHYNVFAIKINEHILSKISPLIIISNSQERHFSVFKKMDGYHTVILDPKLGKRIITIRDFMKEMSDTALYILPQ